MKSWHLEYYALGLTASASVPILGLSAEFWALGELSPFRIHLSFSIKAQDMALH